MLKYFFKNNKKILYGGLSSNTKILLWNGNIKEIKYININDELINSNGNKCKIKDVIIEEDYIYIIKTENNKCFSANKLFILTLYFEDNNKIKWNEVYKTWELYYFDGYKIIYKNGNISYIRRLCTINKFHYNSTEIIDISIENYINLEYKIKKKLKIILNYKCINWDLQNNNKTNIILNVNNIKRDKYKINNLEVIIEDINENNNILNDNNNNYCKLLLNDDYYIINHKKIRLKILAIIIDEIGIITYYYNIPRIYISKKNIDDNILNKIIFLTKSLGYNIKYSYTYNINCYCKKIVNINGIYIYGNNLNYIPLKIQINNKDCLSPYTEFFSIKYKGYDKIYYLKTYKNHRFLLDNFIIV